MPNKAILNTKKWHFKCPQKWRVKCQFRHFKCQNLFYEIDPRDSQPFIFLVPFKIQIVILFPFLGNSGPVPEPIPVVETDRSRQKNNVG